jgi:hypothetical protein
MTTEVAASDFFGAGRAQTKDQLGAIDARLVSVFPI